MLLIELTRSLFSADAQSGLEENTNSLVSGVRVREIHTSSPHSVWNT